MASKRELGNKGKKDGKVTENNGGVELDTRTVHENREHCDVEVLPFDYSVENHFKAMYTISQLCGEAELECREDDGDLARLSSKITFLRVYRDFSYEPREVKFSGGNTSSCHDDTGKRVTLQQFSSAAVPKENKPSTRISSLELSKDFVMYVGGSVWALDWCPRFHEKTNSRFKTHSPGSSYHKLGAPLTGRGAIQIWCIFNINGNVEERSFMGRLKKKRKKDGAGNELQSRKPKGIPKRKLSQEVHQLKKPLGRPRKKLLEGTPNDLNESNLFVPALTVQFLEDTVESVTQNRVSEIEDMHLVENVSHENGGASAPAECLADPVLKCYKRRRLKNTTVNGCQDDKLMASPIENVDNVSSLTDQGGKSYLVKDTAVDYNLVKNNTVETCSNNYFPKDVALPRLVLCLAHNGKVAWDIKWKPSNDHEPKCIHRLGYLAVLLGNGSLEVWEVPRPHAVKVIYSSTCGESTDPRFVKLDPVFRCSMIKSGGIQSIPLTVEWSTSPLNEHLLVGCHDGTVALWKFSVSDSSKDTRPLLCFTADTVPIRALAWAPSGSDPESANVVLTAGHGGIKFWDLRDPFRPLWGLQPVLRNIYSLDWLLDPSCIMLSLDDGTLKMLSLSKVANDVPVTGKNFAGNKQLGLHTIYCSSFAIWSVQVSRATGMVAYASADGDVRHFKLTTKAVEKDPSRNRTPHFMCLSLDEEESTIVIHPPSDIPFTGKKPLNFGGQPNPVPGLSGNCCPNKKASEDDSKLTSQDQSPLALCYDDDPTSKRLFDETLESSKRKVKKKAKPASKTKSRVDPPLATIDEVNMVPPSYVPIIGKKPLNSGGQPNPVLALSNNSCSKLSSENPPPLAICYGDGPTSETWLDETLESFRRKVKKKGKHANKKKSEVDPLLATVDEAAPLSTDEPILALCYGNDSTLAMGSDESSPSLKKRESQKAWSIEKKNNKKEEVDETSDSVNEETEPLASSNEDPQATPETNFPLTHSALCHENDSTLAMGSDESLLSLKKRKNRKTRSIKKKNNKKAEVDETLDGETEALEYCNEEPQATPEASCPLTCSGTRHENDSTLAMGSDEPSLSLKKKKSRKTQSVNKKNSKKAEVVETLDAFDKATEALVSCNEEPQVTPEKTNEGEADSTVQTFPSKLVAMHRVRWNTNKGSERWLCSGSAAGIVHCQEILTSIW